MDVASCGVHLSVLPTRGLMDATWSVLVHNAVPAARLTLHASHCCEAGGHWHAYGHYTADAVGNINVSEDVSEGGTYSGVEPMALLWSLRASPGTRPGMRWRKVDVQTPVLVQVSVFQGFLTEDFEDGVLLARINVERWYMAPDVIRTPITEAGLSATLFLPPGPGPFPGVLDLWGGGRQLVESRSALLASHGFASLALNYLTPYVNEEMGRMVDNSYFEVAYKFLQQHHSVLDSRIAIIGLSFGATIALKMAIYSPVIQPRCVVCVSGSHVQPVDGSLSDIFDYYNRNAAKTRLNEEQQVIWRDLLLPIPSDSSLKADVGRLQCPLLLVFGQDDQNWPTAESAQDMEAMMQRSGNDGLLTVLSYPKAGHLIEPPHSPHTRASHFRSAHGQKFMVLWGGETASHAHAQSNSWTKTIDFLFQHLYRSSTAQL